MTLRTRLTDFLEIEHPVLSAPMAFAAGGLLAATVSSAGGLGLIGGGYGDRAWLEREFAAAGNARVGCGFITWSLASKPELLDLVLERSPAAVMLSFGDPAPFGQKIKAAGSKLICQIQSLEHVKQAVEAGADIIIAQGSEAGGHGMLRATMTLVPEIADYLTEASPSTLLLAAGGIADGRGLAAALMLGADGVLVGSRFWASNEAVVHPSLQQRALKAAGDETIRTTVVDLVRGYTWPREFTGRLVETRFVRDWHGREEQLSDEVTLARERTRYLSAMETGDAENTGVWAGEATALIRDVRPAAELLKMIVAEAESRLKGAAWALTD
jgi:nitronate monooxygenase